MKQTMPSAGRIPGARVRSKVGWPRSAVLVIAASSILGLVACGGGDANLNVKPSENVRDLTRMDAAPPDSVNSWSFLHSIDSWSAAYADGAGQIRLRTHAFVFPDLETAKATYEASRTNLLTGGGGFATAKGARVAGQAGLRLSDDRGEYFQFRRGLWIVVLDGAADHFAPAIEALRWEKRTQP